MNWTPAKDLAARKAYLATVAQMPLSDTIDRETHSVSGNGSCEYGHSPMRYYYASDTEVCLECLTNEVESLADFVGSGGMEANAPLDASPLIADDDMDPPCERCGERGYMKFGDPKDCRSPSCAADKCDAAMDMMDPRD